MGKLPFVVAPKLKSKIETLGTEVSGKIEIERKGYLTVGEKGFMECDSKFSQKACFSKMIAKLAKIA